MTSEKLNERRNDKYLQLLKKILLEYSDFREIFN